ncbi:methylated-DNA--[protein]-cysteine S-methyltransferase [Aquimarina sp. 2201CG14-23]|uniref:methylated-DNA--[protein]-cysteine S-methyltransferase n=1 Tax=Aquimarina mycalae TaxID=3040073 RepID=UPI0024780153|nr:methylated-DNA--[protein]-cysteine S-methyltransferase [Aquimarina sp. 2201CG14-23]MDH7447035.1 methylated-DNA--[protein]-cysteine S-methyltransferase [Aquimarina sp. 2201CG14-23]
MENHYHFDTIKEAIRYINAHYQQQPNLDEIADSVNLSKFHFQRVFQQWAGVSPKHFLQFITTQHAKESLSLGRSTLETAYDVGLSGNGRLHDLFIKIEACTPGEFQKRGKDVTIQYYIINSPFGKVLIAETHIGICKLIFIDDKKNPLALLQSEYPEANFVHQLGTYGSEVMDYFSSWKIPTQQIVLDLKATPFQLSVWKALLSIPSSQLLAYNDVASLINKPNAQRAVGTAIGKNPIAYLIPCHRVIKQTGHLGNYRWGSDRKTAIIGYESVQLKNKQIA